MVKNLPAMQKEDKGSILGLGKSPGEGNESLSFPGELHQQRSLKGYCLWDTNSWT